MQELWEEKKLKFYCGIDGGLKNGIGTSGCNIFISNSDTPFIYDHAAERQDHPSASITRQELLAQVAVGY